MPFNYTAARRHFRENAPGITGYKQAYKAVFDISLEEIELANDGMPESRQTRTIAPNFEQLQQVLRMGKELYYEALNWLDEQGFVQYVKGTRSNQGFIRPMHLPELLSPVADFIPTSSRLNADSMPTSSRPDPDFIPTSSNFPPPHTPPLEVKNNSSYPAISVDEAGGRDGLIQSFEEKSKGYHVPKNIELTEEEENDLVKSWGEVKFQRVMLRVSEFKKSNKGELKASDFKNAITWAAREVEEEDERRRRAAEAKDPQIREHPAVSQPQGVTPKALLLAMQS